MATVMETPDYKIAKIILSQKQPFTLNQISMTLQQQEVKIEKNELKKVLLKFRDNRILVQNELNDSFYVKK